MKCFALNSFFLSKNKLTFTTLFPKNQQKTPTQHPSPTPSGTFSTIAGLASYFYQHPNLRPLLPRFQRGHGTVVWKNIEGSARDIWPQPRGQKPTHPGCQWRMKVYRELLLENTRNVIILLVVTGWGVDPS